MSGQGLIDWLKLSPEANLIWAGADVKLGSLQGPNKGPDRQYLVWHHLWEANQVLHAWQRHLRLGRQVQTQ